MCINCSECQKQFLYTICYSHALSLEFSFSMNNLSSCCGLFWQRFICFFWTYAAQWNVNDVTGKDPWNVPKEGSLLHLSMEFHMKRPLKRCKHPLGFFSRPWKGSFTSIIDGPRYMIFFQFDLWAIPILSQDWVVGWALFGKFWKSWKANPFP